MVRVKICGITNLKDAQAAVDAGADAIGFIFYKKSKRYIAPQKAKQIVSSLPPFVTTVAVFVNEKESVVKRICLLTGVRTIQLHGDETPTYCQRFKGFSVIKAFRVGPAFNFQKLSSYNVNAVLFDTYSKHSYGGTGKAFDWENLKQYKSQPPMILSGGINLKNVTEALKVPHLYALDVSSGVEKSPGMKDHALIRQFMRKAKGI
jgi:phosphoribosylanthranilate isomerase